MKISEAASVNPDDLLVIRRLALEGEGMHLEFKRKATHPEKIVRELIAFANTAGGTLLLGVDDNGSIPGLKYPDEECHVVEDAILKLCKPALVYKETVIAISEDRFVVRFDIPPSQKRPHFMRLEKNVLQSFVREKDMSIKASAEMIEIVRRSKSKQGIRFTFGEAEKILMEYLSQNNTVTLTDYQRISGLNRFKARRKLILLVLANVLKITATEKGDFYSRG